MKIWQSALILALTLNLFACGRASDSETSAVIDPSRITTVVRPRIPLDALRPVSPILVQSLRDQKVLNYAQGRVGQRIDRGECWDLVNEALISAGAKRPFGYENYEFGRAISRSQLAPGNIISFRDVRIQYPNGSWFTFSKHVAIVKQVNGGQVRVLHQNAPIGSAVHEDVLDLNYVTNGTLRYFAADQL